jgi:hypothetical protein
MTDYKRIDRLRKQFTQLDCHERHLAHRHLLDVRRNAGDKSITDNGTHVGCRIRRSDRSDLEALAQSRGTTTSALIREIIQLYLHQEITKWELSIAS